MYYEFLDFCHPHLLVSFDANKLTYDYFRPNDCFLQMISLEIQSFYSKNLHFYTYMFREIVCIICIHLFANNFIRWKMQTIFVCEQFAKYSLHSCEKKIHLEFNGVLVQICQYRAKYSKNFDKTIILKFPELFFCFFSPALLA